MLHGDDTSSTPTASFYSVCDAHSATMSDADDIQLIHIIAEPAAETEMLSWDINDGESKDGAAAKQCKSHCDVHVDDAKFAIVESLLLSAKNVLDALSISTDQLRKCMQFSKQNIDDVLARPHVNDHDNRLNRERVQCAMCEVGCHSRDFGRRYVHTW